jgi:hypothetical protein
VAFNEDLAHLSVLSLPSRTASRPMKGWILVARDGLKISRQLAAWVRRRVQFAGSLPPKS